MTRNIFDDPVLDYQTEIAKFTAMTGKKPDISENIRKEHQRAKTIERSPSVFIAEFEEFLKAEKERVQMQQKSRTLYQKRDLRLLLLR